MQRCARIVAITFVTALLMTACGDDRLTKQEFIARADRICAELNEEVSGLGRPRDAEEFQRNVDRAVTLTRRAHERLRDLKPPEEDEELIDRWLRLSERAVVRLEDVSEALQNQNLDRVNELTTEIQEAANEAQRISQEYGFEECGRGEGTPAG